MFVQKAGIFWITIMFGFEIFGFTIRLRKNKWNIFRVQIKSNCGERFRTICMYNLCNSLSVFKFSMRLQYYTNCSYRVLTEYSAFKSLSKMGQEQGVIALIIHALISEKNKSSEKRKKVSLCETLVWKKKKLWILWNSELRLEDKNNYNILLWMTSENNFTAGSRIFIFSPSHCLTE